ncbi:Acyl-coenzyme A dehydrogenase OS=Castellaniella defragrans OX=75697 GN=HNR28_002038 PE=3 SV=1 [Castellaniella defragrans]
MTIVLVLIVLILIAAGILLSNRAWRLKYLSQPLYQVFRRILPRMSDTEREALEAGTVWWDGALLGGAPARGRSMRSRCRA